MPLLIVQNDITTMRTDAIVNAANQTLLGGGGVDGCIHRAAGPRLLEECRRLGGCPTGSAKCTGAYKLPCRYVIHAVGPRWVDGLHGEQEALISCYQTALSIALDKHCQTVAFPLISAGIFGYPKDRALRTASDTIGGFLEQHDDMMVYLVIHNRSSALLSEWSEIARYIQENSDTNPPDGPNTQERFSEMLLRKIAEKGIANIEKRANVNRRLFSEICRNKDFQPDKPAVLAFAVALELTLPETRVLLHTAGLTLRHDSPADLIVAYFIERGLYNIFRINEALFTFGQPLLGG